MSRKTFIEAERECETTFQLNVVAFELMSNHIHIIISGQEHEIEDYFMYFRARLKRYLAGHGIRLTNGEPEDIISTISRYYRHSISSTREPSRRCSEAGFPNFRRTAS